MSTQKISLPTTFKMLQLKGWRSGLTPISEPNSLNQVDVLMDPSLWTWQFPVSEMDGVAPSVEKECKSSSYP